MPNSSKFYAVKVTAGQEHNVIRVASLRIRSQEIPIKALFAPPNMRGTIIVEADNSGVVNSTLSDMRHVKRVLYGTIKPEEIESMVKVEEEVEVTYDVGDKVEVISGPFKDMIGKITRSDKDKNEVIVEFEDASFSLPVTLSTDMLKKEQ